MQLGSDGAWDEGKPFLAGGEPVVLGGAAETSCLTHRVEALRLYLAERLGEPDFLALYRSLQPGDGSPSTASLVLDRAWAAGLGATVRRHFDGRPERFKLIPTVEQLLRAEAVAFAHE